MKPLSCPARAAGTAALALDRRERAAQQTGGRPARPAPAAEAADAPLTAVERVIIRDVWNKLLAHDAMLIEMFLKRLLIEAPDLAEALGDAVDQAGPEFLRLFDLAVRGLDPRTEDGLREGYRAAPAAADALGATIEECGWFFCAHGLTAAHWARAREVFLWMLRAIPYLEAYDRDNLALGEASAAWRFFTLHVMAPMEAAIAAEARALSPAAVEEMRTGAEALMVRAAEAGAHFYRALFEAHPEILPYFGAADMNALARHLIQAVVFLARSAARGDAARRELRDLAATHRLHGVAPGDYPKLAEPLMATMAAFGAAPSDAAAEGWRTLLRRIVVVMMQPMVAEGRLLARAREFLDQIADEQDWSQAQRANRWAAIETEVRATGTYTQTAEELSFGARVAWRNAPKCIGRIAWNDMVVRDRRHVTDPDAMFAECVRHLREATCGGAVEIVMTVFAPTRPGERWGPRIWNQQLVRFAGYALPDGTVLGDAANVALTEAIMRLGWTPPEPRGAFDVLPLVIDVPGHAPRLFALDPAEVLMVDIAHPERPELAALGLKWCAVPAITNFRLEIGGIDYGCLPFNGWFMETEIARNLFEPDRYDRAEAIAAALRLDTSSEATLWRDRAFLELNVAVLHSFARDKVTLVDHQTAARQFMIHDQREKRAGRECPAQGSWIVPAAGGSTTPVWHHEMRDFHLRPAYRYAADRWAVEAGQIGAAGAAADGAVGAVRPLVLFASATGAAEGYARKAGRRLAAHGAQVRAMDEVDPESLRGGGLALLIVSTFRDGETPTNGKGLLAWLEAQEAGSLGDLRFAVLGIGNRIYPRFCAAGVAFDAALARAGARRIAEVERADELAGQADTARRWMEMIATLLGPAAAEAAPRRRPSAQLLPPPARPAGEPAPAPDRIVATVMRNDEMLRDAEAGRSTRRIDLRLEGDGPRYGLGDHVAILPRNPPALVERLCRRLDLDPGAWVRLAAGAEGPLARFAEAAPLTRLLGRELDLSMPAAPEELVAATLEATDDAGERARLETWRDTLALPPEDARRRALREELARRFHDMAEFLDAFPRSRIDLGALVDVTPRMRPRFYSIGSSPRARPDTLALTVGVVDATGPDGRPRRGLCSGWLADLAVGATLEVTVSRPPRRLPDDFDGPLLLVAAGTGVAPLIGALEDRAARGAAMMGPAALYFGCRDAGEFLFEPELRQWRAAGVLTRLGVAFSRRERRKAYVQDVMDADGAAVWGLLTRPGARVLVCGDARMGDDVRDRLVEIAQREGALSYVAAAGLIDAMRRDGRYVEDVWGVQLHRATALEALARARYEQGVVWLDRMRRGPRAAPGDRGAQRIY